MTTSIQENVNFYGITTFANSMVLSAGCVSDANVNVAAAIDADKLQHRHPLDAELIASASAVTAITKLLHISAVTGTVMGLKAAVMTAATGADRTVTVDLQKSTGGAAFATVLTTAVILNNASVARVAQNAVVNATLISLVAGDILQVVVTVAGSANDQAKGLVISAVIDENAV